MQVRKSATAYRTEVSGRIAARRVQRLIIRVRERSPLSLMTRMMDTTHLFQVMSVTGHKYLFSPVFHLVACELAHEPQIIYYIPLSNKLL